MGSLHQVPTLNSRVLALGGHHDGNDAQWLRSDPLYQTLAGVSPDADTPLAGGSTCNRFLNVYTRREGELPPEDRDVIYEQRQAQIDRIIGFNKHLVDLYIRTRRVRPGRIIIDVDPTDDPAHGRQQLTLWHGYYDQNQYYPVLAFDGDSGLPLAAWLRAGNSGAACGVVDILREIVDHLRGVWPDVPILLREVCGVGGPQVYEYCEAAGLSNAVGYAANEVLKRRTRGEMAHVEIVTWAYGRPHRQFQTFDDYQASSWDKPRRVIAKLETTATLEANRRFLVTNMTESPQFIYEEFYCQRGDVPERSIGELKQGLGIDRLSSHRSLNNAQKLLIPCPGLLAVGVVPRGERGCSGNRQGGAAHGPGPAVQGRRAGQMQRPPDLGPVLHDMAPQRVPARLRRRRAVRQRGSRGARP